MVTKMLSLKENWESVLDFAFSVMIVKEEVEIIRRGERQS